MSDAFHVHSCALDTNYYLSRQIKELVQRLIFPCIWLLAVGPRFGLETFRARGLHKAKHTRWAVVSQAQGSASTGDLGKGPEMTALFS